MIEYHMVVVEVPFDCGCAGVYGGGAGLCAKCRGMFFTVGATCPIVGMRQGLGLVVVVFLISVLSWMRWTLLGRSGPPFCCVAL